MDLGLADSRSSAPAEQFQTRLPSNGEQFHVASLHDSEEAKKIGVVVDVAVIRNGQRGVVVRHIRQGTVLEQMIIQSFSRDAGMITMVHAFLG